MSMSCRLAPLALVLTMLSASALADTTNTSLGTLGTSATTFGRTFSSNMPSFTDYYTFSIGSSGAVSGTTTDANLYFTRDVVLSSLVLTSLDSSITYGTDSAIPTNGTTNSFSFTSLTAGSYKLAVNGSATASWLYKSSYSGTLSTTPSAAVSQGSGSTAPVASPAPEASDLAMTVLGLAGVAWLVRRRKA
jgi:hypothetical protein